MQAARMQLKRAATASRHKWRPGAADKWDCDQNYVPRRGKTQFGNLSKSHQNVISVVFAKNEHVCSEMLVLTNLITQISSNSHHGYRWFSGANFGGRDNFLQVPVGNKIWMPLPLDAAMCSHCPTSWPAFSQSRCGGTDACSAKH